LPANTTCEFGIVVPVGPGQRPWLIQTLRSLDAQDADLRIAICAVENSPELEETLRPFTHLIDYIRHAPDSGQSAAINEGWSVLNAKYYSWLNDDDMLHPEALKKVSESFAETNADVIHGRSDIIDNAHIRRGYGHHPIEASLLRENRIAQPSCFVTRNALLSICQSDDLTPVDPDKHYSMDWDLWQRLYLEGSKFHALSDSLSITRWYNGTKTASPSFTKYREYWHLLRHDPSKARRLWTLFNMLMHNQANYGPVRTPFRMIETALSMFGKSNEVRHDNLPDDLEVFHFGDKPLTLKDEQSGDTVETNLTAGNVFRTKALNIKLS